MDAPTLDEQMISDLRNSIEDCKERGLNVACKWSSELLLSISLSKRNASPSIVSTSTPTLAQSCAPSSSLPLATDKSALPTPEVSTQVVDTPTRTPYRHPHAPPIKTQPDDIRFQELEWEKEEQDLLVSARAHMDVREYSRAFNLLKECKSAKARFLSVYSQFMASEKKAIRDWHKLDNNRRQPASPVNTSLVELLEMVKDATEPWLMFLKALFLSRLSRREEAMESALLSIASYPWNWSTWLLLANCIGDGDELSTLLPLIPLPQKHPLTQMFQVKTLNELHNPSESELGFCDRLLTEDFFPTSLWVMSLRACVLYHLHDFGAAEAQFEKIRAVDPYRIDDIDVYSNILYVTDNRLKLSRLAHEFLALDKDRPEVCCLVGNHYSLRSEHEKAVKYFRRATQLDQTYLSAWTLMGHEYVEMKNAHAAIEAYRRAVDVNRKDYRAWYGLGQAYELLSMHQYALHYYQHASALRPYDMRLWQSQGMCYEEIGRLREAAECLKRALVGTDPHEININLRLARLHRILEEYNEAVAYYRRVVEICLVDMRPIQDYAKPSIYVALHHMTVPNGDLLLAREYLERVATSNAEEVSQATELLKRLRHIIQEKSAEKGKGKGKMVDADADAYAYAPVTDAGEDTAMVTD